MPRVSNPVITVDKILSIPPGETLILSDIDEKKKSSIYTMVGYVKWRGFPRGVRDYKCSYDAQTKECHVTAIST